MTMSTPAVIEAVSDARDGEPCFACASPSAVGSTPRPARVKK